MVETLVKNRRRFLRFGLRTLFVLMLIVGCGLGWLMHQRRQNAERRAAILAAGFSMQERVIRLPQLFWRRWLWGDEWPGDATGLEGDDTVTDAALAQIAGLNQLQDLYLDRCPQVTDAGLTHLKELTQLEYLDLSGTQLTDAGLEHLRKLTRLKRLNLSNTKFTDKGLLVLAELSQLVWMELDRTNLTDAGLRNLSGLTHLQVLYVQDTKVTEGGIEKLKSVLPTVHIVPP